MTPVTEGCGKSRNNVAKRMADWRWEAQKGNDFE